MNIPTMDEKQQYIKPSIERQSIYFSNVGVISFGKGCPKWLYEKSVKK